MTINYAQHSGAHERII